MNHWESQNSPETVLAQAVPAGLALHVPLTEGQGNVLGFKADDQWQTLSADNMTWVDGYASARAWRPLPAQNLEIADAGDFEKDQPFSCGAWVKIDKINQYSAIVARMDDTDAKTYRGWDLWIENGKLSVHLVHHWTNKDALQVIVKNPIKANEWHHMMMTYDGSGKAAGCKLFVDGAEQQTDVAVDGLKNTCRTSTPLALARRRVSFPLVDSTLQDVRIYNRVVTPAEISQLVQVARLAGLIAKPVASHTPQEAGELLFRWVSTFDAPTQQLIAASAKLNEEEGAIKSRGAITHVMQERNQQPEAHVLFRGEYDKRRDKVGPSTPAWLPPMPSDAPKNRLGLAQWLLLPEHPLTARVTVNRFWQEVFGTGLVRTSGDLGVSGEMPSHPELLDWLAVQFRESGWNTKQYFRMLLTSATYRQSAAVTAAKIEKDGQNRLLSRGPRYRMDAEMVRDYALATSGLLVRKLGGPSVRPYQPPGIWEAVAMPESNTPHL